MRALFSRRRFLQSASAAIAACVVPIREAWARVYQVKWTSRPGDAPFLSPQERAFIEAAVDRLIPADASGPGAREVGVPRFIDRQLSGPFGRAERWYMGGPFRDGTPTQGYQLPYTPAQFFRRSIAAVEKQCQAGYGGRRFAKLKPDEQDALLTRLQKGELRLEGWSSATFFGQLHQMTMQGFFADPMYGGNQQKAGWKLVGFPGARGAYVGVIEQYNQPFTEAPLSIADLGGGGHAHGASPKQ
jgi:gluconate 2-dehydrogenase gamma chain